MFKQGTLREQLWLKIKECPEWTSIDVLCSSLCMGRTDLLDTLKHVQKADAKVAKKSTRVREGKELKAKYIIKVKYVQ